MARRTLRPIRPNVGVRVAYTKRLDALINEMANSVEYWATSTYRANPSEMQLGMDASPAATMRAAMTKLSNRWLRKFSRLSQQMAQGFAESAQQTTDSAFRSALADANFTVKFKMTPAMNDALQATIGENVGLIKSIPAEYLTQVQGSVMRSVTKGRDVAGLVEELKEQHGVTTRRAKFIAFDQNNKACATFQKVRRQELGIKEARWKHSGGGRTPRPAHVAFSGTIYNVNEGALISGKRIWPGTEPNCRCFDMAVLPDLAALRAAKG